MVTHPKLLKSSVLGILWLLVGLSHASQAQPGDAYKVAIKTQGGGPAIIGFLYAVNDTAIVILPSGLPTKKGLQGALERPNPVSIPSKLVKRLQVSKLRTVGHDATVGTLIGLGYSILYIALVPIYTPAGLIPYFLTVTTASVLTASLIYWKKYKPGEPGFKIKMQKYCLKKDALMVDR